MNYGTYNSANVSDEFVKCPVHAVMNVALKKRARIDNGAKVSEVYLEWVNFLKRKTLFDEYMLYTALLVETAVEFDTYERLRDFCKQYSKVRLVMKRSRVYVNWSELYDEFIKEHKSKRPFWKRIFGIL